MECRGRHRAARLPQAAVVVLGFVAGDMYDKESGSDSYVCVCGSGVVCRVERSLRKPVYCTQAQFHPLIA